MAKILLFGGGLQVISVARSLKEVGHYVWLVSKNDKIAKKSRYIDGWTDCIDDINPKYVLDTLVGIVQQNGIDVIIPMEDAQASSLSQCKNTLEKETKVKCAVMDWDVFEMASDKTKLLAFCQENNIEHPKTKRIDNNYDELAEVIGFPSLIKPSHSEGAKGIVPVYNIDELKKKAPLIISQFGDCSLQEYICNKDYYFNLMLYRGLDGSYGNYTIIKILRYYPIRGGSSSLSVSVDDKKMVNMCKELLEKLNWKGFADFDILENEDGDYKIIEINPRVPASVRGAAISGVNFPEVIVQDLLTGKYPLYEYKTGKYLRYLGLDIAWFMASPNRFKCIPSWFRFFGKNLYYQEGGHKDIPAFLTSMLEGVKKQLNPEFRKAKSGLN